MNNNHGRRRTRRARRQQPKAQIGKFLLTACLMALVVAVSIGGTIAWLTADTTPVTNTFTTAGIGIELKETLAPDGTELASGTAWSAQMIPGKEYSKNPKVTVSENTNVDIYLFVKLEATDSAKYLTYSHIWDTDTTNWHKLTGVDGVDNVWYREVLTTDEKTYSLIPTEKVTVKSELVKSDETAEGALKMPTAAQTMTYTAYAIQKEGSADAAAAWAKISGN